MEGPPPRFRCPPEFEAAPGGVPMGGPQTELWLIRAPRDFCPQSLEGCPVPLNGLERLRPARSGDNADTGDNDNDTAAAYVLRAVPAGARAGAGPLLLSPVSPGGSLRCGPALSGSLSIARGFATAAGAPGDTAGTAPPPGDTAGTAPPPWAGTAPPPGDTAPPPPGDTAGTAPPPGDTAGTAPPPGDTAPPPGAGGTEGPGPPEGTGRRKKRKKKEKRKREGQE